MKLEVICGPMFSGKTEELIRRLSRLKFAKKDFLLFKPEVDTRYSENSVMSHSKNSLMAIVVNKAEDILTTSQQNPDIKVIAIDEAQFFLENELEGRNLLEVIEYLKQQDYRIIINGLDLDFTGKPFGLMPKILSMADEVSKLKAVCVICGEDASISYRVHNHQEIVKLGGQGDYQARCYKHWLEGRKK